MAVSFHDYRRKKDEEEEKKLQSDKKADISFAEASERRKEYGSLKNYGLATDTTRAKRIDEQMQDLSARRLVDAATSRGTPVEAESYGKNNKWNDYATVMSERKSDYDRAVEKLKRDLDVYPNTSGIKNYLDATKAGYDNAIALGKSAAEFGSQFKSADDFKRWSIGWDESRAGDENFEDTEETRKARKEYYEGLKKRRAELQAEKNTALVDYPDSNTSNIYGSEEWQNRENILADANKNNDEIEALDAEIARYERFMEVQDKYAKLREDPNFERYAEIEATHSGYGVDKNGNTISTGNNVVDDYFGVTEKYKDVNVTDPMFDARYGVSDQERKLIEFGYDYSLDELTEEEKQTYRYLLSTQGADSADQFLEDMKPTLNRRATQREANELKNASGWELAVRNIMSVPQNILGGVTAAVADVVQGDNKNPYDKWHRDVISAGNVRGETAERMGNVGGFIYQSLMSAADSVAGAVLMGRAYTLTMGAGASANRTRELYEKGASNYQILTSAFMSGLTEVVTEYVSVDKFLKDFLEAKPKNALDLVKKIFMQGGVEASEEFAAEVLNTIQDEEIMGSQSDMNLEIKELMDQGVSREEAQRRVLTNHFVEAVKAAAGGFISGVAMGGGAGVLNSASNAIDTRREGRYVNENNGAEALQNLAREVAGAQNLTKAVDKVTKKASNKNVGKLSRALEQTISNEAETRAEKGAKYVLAREGVDLSDVKAREGTNLYNNVDVSEKISDTGTTVDTETGGEVTIDEKNPITQRDGKTYLNTSAGEILQDDIKYSSEKEAQLYEYVSDLPQSVANAIVENYKGQENVRGYVNGMRDGILLYGYNNIENAPKNTAFATLDKADQQYARQIGQTLATEDLNVKKENLKSATIAQYKPAADERLLTGKEIGLKTKYAVAPFKGAQGKGGAVYLKGSVDLNNNLGRANGGFMYSVASAFGRNMVLYDSTDENIDPKLKNKNGKYVGSDGTIYIDINAGTEDGSIKGAVAYTLGHELTHEAEDWAPEEYAAFKNFLYENYMEVSDKTKWTVEDLINHMMERLDTTDRAFAESELVAEACEKMILDSDATEKIAEQTEATWRDKVIEWIRNALAKLKDAYDKVISAWSLASVLTDQFSTDNLKQLQDMWSEMIVKSSLNKAAANETKLATEAKETPVEFSIKHRAEIADVSEAYAYEHRDKLTFDYELVAKAEEEIDKIATDIETKLKGKTDKNGQALIPEETKLSNNIFSNSSYLKDAEPTTECWRQMVYRDLYRRVTDKLGRPLTAKEAVVVNQAAIEIGVDSPCLYCYSLLDRKAKEGYKLQYLAERDGFLKNLDKDFKGDVEAFKKQRSKVFDKYNQRYLSRVDDPSAYDENGVYDKSKARTPNKAKEVRVNLWLDVYENLYKNGNALNANDIRNVEAEGESKAAFSNIEDKAIRDLKLRELKDALDWAQASSQAKKLIPYSAYSNFGKDSILNWSKATINKLNSEYGLRWYSHADYHPAFVVDNMQQVVDASLLGLKGLMYCKPTEIAEIMAPTGMNINISCFVQVDPKTGKFSEDAKMGAPWKEVQRLRRKHGNVGAVMVVTSDEQMFWALTQDWIDVVIPIHLVRSGDEFLKEFGLTNYTSEQADKLTDKQLYDKFIADICAAKGISEDGKAGKALKKGMKTIYPTEHQNDYQTYMDAINERGLTPRFDRIRLMAENGTAEYNGVKVTPQMYMKLVNETRQSAEQTSPLKPVFNNTVAEDAVNEIEKKGYHDFFKEAAVNPEDGQSYDVEGWANIAARDIKAGKTGSQVGYGRNLSKDITSRRQAQKEGIGGTHDQFSTKQNARYMELAKDPVKNEAELQQMVDEAVADTGYGYRRNTRRQGTPQNNDAPFYLFVKDSPNLVLDQYGKYKYVATDKNAVDVSEVENKIKDGWKEFAEEYDYPQELTEYEINPRDIVDTAGVWDNLDFVTYLFDNGYLDADIKAIRTSDGLVVFDSNQVKSADPVVYDNNGKVIPLEERFNPENERYSLKQGETVYNNRVILNESTVNKYLRYYAAEDIPNYAQAYITYISPEAFNRLATATEAGRRIIEEQTRDLDVQELAYASGGQPMFFDIDHKTGQVKGHEGRHRMNALGREGVTKVPVLLFDYSNKYDKTRIPAMVLFGQKGLNGEENYSSEVVYDLIPLNYENRDEIVKKFSEKTGTEKVAENYGRQTVQYSRKSSESYAVRDIVNRALKRLDPSSAEYRAMAKYKAELDTLDNMRAQLDEAIKNNDRQAQTRLTNNIKTQRGILNRIENSASMKSVASMRDVTRLADDAKKLREMLKLQSRETNGTIAKQRSVNAAASEIMEKYGIKRGKGELAELLGNYYTKMMQSVNNETMTREAALDQAKDVAEWIARHVPDEIQYDDGAIEALDMLRGYKVKLNDNQRQNIRAKYDNINGWRRAVGGYITLSNEGKYLDELWSEWAERAPGYFTNEMLSDADMPERLAEIIDSLKKSRETVIYTPGEYEYDLERAANDVYEAFWNIEPEQTVADKYADRIKTLKAEHNAMMSDLRKSFRDTIREERSNMYSEAKERARDYNEKLDLRRKVRKVKEDLTKRLDKPTIKKYVPKDLRSATAELLSTLNLASEKNEPSQRTLERIAKLQTIYDGYKDENVVYDKQVSEWLSELRDTVGSKSISELTKDELKSVYKILKAFTKNITEVAQVKSLYASGVSAEKTVDVVAREWMRNIERINPALATYFNTMGKLLGRPELVFRIFGNMDRNSISTKVYDMMNAAQLEYNRIRQEGNRLFEEMFEGKASKKYLEELHDTKKLYDIGLKDANGKPVEVTKDFALWLYRILMNENGIKHVSTTGGVMPDFKKYYNGGEAYGKRATRVVGFLTDKANDILDEVKEKSADIDEQIEQAKSEGDYERVKELWNERDNIWAAWDQVKNDGREVLLDTVQKNISKILTPQDKRFLELAAKFYDEWSKGYMNKASNERHGIDIADEENYTRIHTAEDYRGATLDSSNMESAIGTENMGFTKRRVGATNPIYFEGLSSAIAKHIDEVATYAAYLNPLYDLRKILNYTEGGINKSGTVRSKLNDKFGKGATNYIYRLAANVKGESFDKFGNVGFEKVFDELLGRVAEAALTANGRVVAYQTVSALNAATELGYGRTAATFLTKFFKKAPTDLIAKYTPIYEVRRSSGSTDEVANMKNAAKNRGVWYAITYPGTHAIQAMDLWTVGRLWFASESYVQKHNKNLKPGTEEFYKAVGKKFTNVVELTQPNYAPMQRNQLQRSKNPLARALTMFRTQPFQNLNNAIGASFQFAHDIAGLKNGTTTKAEARESGAKLYRTATSLVASAAMMAVINAVWNALVLHGHWRWRDDETGEFSWEKFGEWMLDEALGRFFSNDPLAGEAYSFIGSKIFDRKYYPGFSMPQVEVVTDALETLSDSTDKIIAGEWNAKKEGREMATKIGRLFGIPVDSIAKPIEGIYMNVQDIINGEFGSFDYGYEYKNKQLAAQMLLALETDDEEKYEKARSKFPGTKTQTPEEQADAALKKAIGDMYIRGQYTYGETKEMLEEYLDKDEKEAEKQIDRWDYAKVHGNQDGYTVDWRDK